MRFGVYVHIPYCLQKCSYCDFAKYLASETIAQSSYVDLLEREIRCRGHYFSNRTVETVFFGGGTPSLLEIDDLTRILASLRNQFKFSPDAEITLEVNPATLTEQKLADCQKIGINRYSLGLQTFDDQILKRVGRLHSANETRESIRMLQRASVNYSVDLLFALPGQTNDLLQKDLAEILEARPPHISTYCLTIPESHPLNHSRPSEDHQLEMFSQIDVALRKNGYDQYEISNYCLENRESRHNQLYWDDSEYWGIGLSSHSFFHLSKWGVRFWNHRQMQSYQDWVNSPQLGTSPNPTDDLPSQSLETLSQAEACFDYCHTALRTSRGLNLGLVEEKFGIEVAQKILRSLQPEVERGLAVQFEPGRFRLTPNGVLLSNQVFEALGFD